MAQTDEQPRKAKAFSVWFGAGKMSQTAAGGSDPGLGARNGSFEIAANYHFDVQYVRLIIRESIGVI